MYITYWEHKFSFFSCSFKTFQEFNFLSFSSSICCFFFSVCNVTTSFSNFDTLDFAKINSAFSFLLNVVISSFSLLRFRWVLLRKLEGSLLLLSDCPNILLELLKSILWRCFLGGDLPRNEYRSLTILTTAVLSSGLPHSMSNDAWYFLESLTTLLIRSEILNVLKSVISHIGVVFWMHSLYKSRFSNY